MIEEGYKATEAHRQRCSGRLSWRTHVSTALIVDTLIGPMLLGGSAGFDGRWRRSVGIGRLVRSSISVSK